MDKFLEDAQNWLRVRLSFIVIMFLLYGSAMVVLIALLGKALVIPTGGGNGIPIRLDVLWLLAILVYTGLSIDILGPTEIGSKIIFGRPTYDVFSGLMFVPRWICEVQSFPKINIQITIGGGKDDNDPEARVPRDSDRDRSSDIEFRDPFRVNFPPLEQVEKIDPSIKGKFLPDDPLTKRLTSDPTVTLLVNIDSPTAFLQTIGNVDKASVTLAEVARGGLQEYCAGHVAAEVYQNKKHADEILLRTIEELIGEPKAIARALEEARVKGNEDEVRRLGNIQQWGLNASKVVISDLGLPRRINEAMATASKSVSTAAALVTLAEANKIKLAKAGEGRGAAISAEMQGEALGLHAEAWVLTTPEGREARRYRGIEKTLGGSTKTVVLADPKDPTSDLYQAAAAISGVVKNST